LFKREVTSAPKEIIGWGAVDGTLARRKIQAAHGIHKLHGIFDADSPYEFIPITQYVYDGHTAAPCFQAGTVDKIVTDSKVEFGLVVIEIRNNWGSTMTCLNRVYVLQQT
jgi:hypothetical protein